MNDDDDLKERQAYWPVWSEQERMKEKLLCCVVSSMFARESVVVVTAAVVYCNWRTRRIDEEADKEMDGDDGGLVELNSSD